MSIIFGFGIEDETTINFTDKNRIKRAMTARESEKINLNNIYWRRVSRTWKGGWHSNNMRDPIALTGDGSVDGNNQGHGFEVQTNISHSKNVKPKVLINHLFLATNDLAKDVKGDGPYRIANPFGSSVGFSGKAVGSYHLNFTFPYDSEKTSNEAYLKKYREKTFRGIKVVRAIEPLFFAMIGGADLNSVGQPNWAEGSSRQAYNHYGNLGNVALDTTFRRAWFGNSHGQYKSGNNTAPFKNKLVYTVNGKTVELGEWGDINPRHFPNIDSEINSVEFRFLDPFFVPNVYEIVKVVIAAMDHGDNVGDITDGKTSDAWNNAAQAIVEEGWNAKLSKDYLQMLKTKLGLNIPVKDGMRADIVFQSVVKELWAKNKSGFFVKHMLDEFAEPKVLNLNRYNWDMQFRHKYVNKRDFTSYIDKFIVTLSKINASSSDGWVKVNFDETDKKTIRDIILDDTTYGMDMGTEDTEDILFLLERIGAIKLKTNTTVDIVALKVLFTDPKEVMKKIDNLQTIDGVEETYFGEETETIEEEIPEPEPEPEPVETDTPVHQTPGRRAILSTTDNTNIDMSQLRIMGVRPERDSDLDYNIRDFNGLFESANFISLDGNPFQVSIFAANIKYGNRALPAFWVKNGHNIKIYLDAEKYNSEQSMSELVDVLKSDFYSPRSVERTTQWMPDMTTTEFFNKLKTIARNHYKTVRPTQSKTIMLDAAGLETLKSYKLRIASLSRGQRYFIVNKYKLGLLKQRYHDKIQLIKYMPYQKKIYVQKIGNRFNLYMNGQLVDKIGGNSQ